ncbi:hypothetical protein [Rathayibacter soli]|uniref:hypothetical protein n=1 Tax=Rathayibacter soli TaxID=3144168 RepID=UPI0027E50747|nr:hypothetical protein [Glaciibacter superstes]
MRNRFRILAATGLVAASLVGIAGAASAASADAAAPRSITDVVYGKIKHNATSFNATSTRATAVGHFTAEDEVETLCHREGQTLNGRSLWFKISQGLDKYDQPIVSYIHADSIFVEPESVGYCYNTP